MDRLRKWLGLWLWPLGVIYSIVVYLRNLLFDLKVLPSNTFAIPIISVGNITVGGTGKTPQVEYLIRLLYEKYQIGVLSRGYKRKTRGTIIAPKNTSPDEIGDEPMQVKQKFPAVRVAVSASRVKGVKALLGQFPKLDVIILDDAFQHRYIKPGLSILLIDYARLPAKDKLLPVGDLREPPSAICRADIIIVTKTPSAISPLERMLVKEGINPKPLQKLFFSTIAYEDPQPVYKKAKVNISMAKIRKKRMRVLLVTGIANSGQLAAWVSQYAHELEELCFPDHHNFSHQDLNTIASRFEESGNEDHVILTTEKDAIRIKAIRKVPAILKKNLWYIPIEPHFLFRGDKAFNKEVLGFVTQNKASNKEGN